MTFARVVPVVVAAFVLGACGVRAADGDDSHAESVDSAEVANTSDEADEGETSEDGDETGLTLEDIDEVCRVAQTRKGCAAASNELMEASACVVDGVSSICGCQWVVHLTLPSDDGDCSISNTDAYCRGFATPAIANPGCLIGGLVGNCDYTRVGYQESNEAGVYAVGTITEDGCFSPDAGTGTDYVSCYNETDSPTCQCLMAEAEKICM